MLNWPVPDARMKRSHGNSTDATEMGAYAIAGLAVHAVDGRRVIARTPTESGADVWTLKSDDPPDAQVRLEVSGTAKGSVATLRRLLDEKVDQVKSGKSSEPGLAAVVGFEVLRILVSEIVGK
jgi:hypothetical protein